MEGHESCACKESTANVLQPRTYGKPALFNRGQSAGPEEPWIREKRNDGCNRTYQSTASCPYAMDGNREFPGSWRVWVQVEGMRQMQGGFRQRLSRRANLPALQGQICLAQWRRSGYPRIATEINEGPWFIEPKLRIFCIIAPRLVALP